MLVLSSTPSFDAKTWLHSRMAFGSAGKFVWYCIRFLISFASVTGVAYSGVPCSSSLGYTVNMAVGLDAAFYVAHEMGHK
jgi:hypothetical protein